MHCQEVERRFTVSKKKIKYITLSQIIAMFLIVLSHSFSKRIEQPPNTMYYVSVIQGIGLTLFMFISGFLFEKTEQMSKYSIGKIIKKRAIRLLIPYVVIQIIMYIPKYIMASYSNIPVELSMEFIIKSFLNPRSGILPHLWFLPVLFVITCIVVMVYPLFRNNKMLILITSIISVLTIIKFDKHVIAGIDDIVHYLFWFLFGICFVR